MTSYTAALDPVGYLAFLIAVGFFAEKTKFLPKLNQGTSLLVTKITLPIMVIVSLSDQNVENISATDMFSVLLIGMATIIFLVFINKGIGKLLHVPHERLLIHSFLGSFGNVIFLAYPFILQHLGETGLLYAIMYSTANEMLLYSFGVSSLRRGSQSGDKKWNLKYLINPNTVSFVIGILLFSFKLRLPEFLHKPLDSLGDTTVPLSMLFIGSTLALTKLKESFKTISVWLCCTAKMIVVPLVYILIVILTDLSASGTHNLMITVLIMQIAMPTQTSLSVLAHRYGADATYAAQVIFASTLISVITLPLMYMLCTSLFPI